MGNLVRDGLRQRIIPGKLFVDRRMAEGSVAPKIQDQSESDTADSDERQDGQRYGYHGQGHRDLSFTTEQLRPTRYQTVDLSANADDATRRAYLGRNNGRLSDLFAAPDSVQQIRRMVERGAQTPVADAALRSLIQAPGALNVR